jgi:hypothetical protein
VKIGNVNSESFHHCFRPRPSAWIQLEQAESPAGARPPSSRPSIPFLTLITSPLPLAERKAPFFTAEYRLDMEQGLRLVEAARKKCKDLVIIANYSTWRAGYRRLAGSGPVSIRRGADPGAEFLLPNMSFNVDISERAKKDLRPSSGASMGQDEKRSMGDRKHAKSPAPLIAKITPEGGGFPRYPRLLLNPERRRSAAWPTAWAFPPSTSGTTRSRYNLQGQNTMACLSGPWIKPCPRDVFEIRKL